MAEDSSPVDDISTAQPAAETLPRRSSKRIVTTAAVAIVVVVVMVAGVAYYLDIHKYPSEDTPLVLQSWGVSWVMEQGDPDQLFFESPFENMVLWWTDYDGVTVGTPPLNSTIPRVSMSEFELPDDSATLFETYIVGWHSDDTVNGVRIIGAYGVFVTDGNENGLFDSGDALSVFHGVYENGTLTEQGFLEDTEYGIGLGPPGGGSIQFKYAIHHGRFYAWESD